MKGTSITRYAGSALPLLLILGSGCGPSEPDHRPNIIWIVWDTARADRLTPYGYDKPTTPHLDSWSKDARVFENCIAVANNTAPSHASMFTGLMPTQHGVDYTHLHLDDKFITVAELLRDSGYQTFLYSANPHVSQDLNLAQGFETVEHPWSAKYTAAALDILQKKVPPQDRSSEIPARMREEKLRGWDIKACGELTQGALRNWLKRRDGKRPFFAFLNYMEAHRPYIPWKKYREKMMDAGQVERSYLIERSWLPMWSYTFGLKEYTQEELEIMAATYDACLAELDDLLKDLLAALEAGGNLKNTVIILTSDHGEKLGEHHMLDHQFSLYTPLIHVPLIIKYPSRFPAGRDHRPVMNFDLFPTILELAELEAPKSLPSAAVSLFSAPEERALFSEYPSPLTFAIDSVAQANPAWDYRPWLRKMRAVIQGKYKYIWGSDRRCELYDMEADPGELNNLLKDAPDEAIRLSGILESAMALLSKPVGPVEAPKSQSEEQIKRLASLGYTKMPGNVNLNDPLEPAPATQPAPGSVCP